MNKNLAAAGIAILLIAGAFVFSQNQKKQFRPLPDSVIAAKQPAQPQTTITLASTSPQEAYPKQLILNMKEPVAIAWSLPGDLEASFPDFMVALEVVADPTTVPADSPEKIGALSDGFHLNERSYVWDIPVSLKSGFLYHPVFGGKYRIVGTLQYVGVDFTCDPVRSGYGDCIQVYSPSVQKLMEKAKQYHLESGWFMFAGLSPQKTVIVPEDRSNKIPQVLIPNSFAIRTRYTSASPYTFYQDLVASTTKDELTEIVHNINQLPNLTYNLVSLLSQKSDTLILSSSKDGTDGGSSMLYSFALGTRKFTRMETAYNYLDSAYPDPKRISPDGMWYLSVSHRGDAGEQTLYLVNFANDSVTDIAKVSGNETLVKSHNSWAGFPVGAVAWIDNRTIRYSVFDKTREVDNGIQGEGRGTEHPILRNETLSLNQILLNTRPTMIISVPEWNSVFIKDSSTLVLVTRDATYQPSTTYTVNYTNVMHVTTRPIGGGAGVATSIPLQDWLKRQLRVGDPLPEGGGAPGSIEITGVMNDAGVLVASSIVEYSQ